MIRHMLRLVWNRRKLNALVMTEIFFSFLVLFVVLTMSLHLLQNLRSPLGFDWQNVWNVSIDVKQASDDDWTAEGATTFENLLHEVEQLPEVEIAAGVMHPPYAFGGSNGGVEIEGKPVQTDVDEVTDDFAELLRMHLIDGRFFGPEDDASPLAPVVVDREFAIDAFGDPAVAGRTFQFWGDKEVRIVGVVDDFRVHGELSSPANFLFRRVKLGDPTSRPPRNILIRFKGPVNASFERELMDRLQAVAPAWSFEIDPLSSMRDSAFRFSLVPVVIGGVIATFLILMVALGLIGVLWQNITRRTDELALRRAVGATARNIHRQVLLETLIIATFGLAVGVLLVLQAPAFGIASFISPAVFSGGMILSIVTIYLLALACSLYPSWLASRIQPAVALQYE